MLVLVPACQQTTSPEQLRFGPIDPDDFDVFVTKSRVHFRRGFDDNGYAPTIVLVDAPPCYGSTEVQTVRATKSAGTVLQ